MLEIRQTESFSKWLHRLRDHVAKAKILIRIDRLRIGLLGDVKTIGPKLMELRVDFGPGYRIYITKRQKELIILLVGGDKKSQKQDITKAKNLLKEL